MIREFRERLRSDWPVVGVTAAILLLLLLLPLFFGGLREDGYCTYRIMWLNYLGHRFKLPLETPKPLYALLCGVVGHGALYPVTCTLCAGICALLMKMAQRLGASAWQGLVAFCLFLVGNAMVLPEFVMASYYTIPYLFLTLAAVYAFVSKRPLPAMFFLLGAGLLRPEAWLFAPVFILASVFRKERGFSWWLLASLTAPLIWVLFDERISGSPTYSQDLTDYYVKTLGIMPVSFGQFWGEAARATASTFFPPTHLFGLAALVYVAARTRRHEHLVMAILAVVPFMFLWLLSAGHPVLVQTRFFAFPMLVCCFYAALVMREFSKNRWILVLLSAALLCGSFQFGMLSDTARRIRNDGAIEEARKDLVESVRTMESNADVILCGRSASYFAYHLGERASRKLFMFREAEARTDFEKNFSNGVAVYIQDDMAGLDNAFKFLSAPRIYEVNGYRFSPVKVTTRGNGIVYAVERLPRRLIPPQGLGAAPPADKAGGNR